MSPFNGFPSGRVHLTKVPETFFDELLPQIDNLPEMKVTLYVLWFLERQEGSIRYIRARDFLRDQHFMYGLAPAFDQAQLVLSAALEAALLRGSLLVAHLEGDPLENTLYFLNSPRGRAAVKALQAGEWSPGEPASVEARLTLERPTIFQLYEQNIGPLTPMLAETLQEAEQEYPPDWIEDAMREAVTRNKRSWRYVQAILRAWKERGRHGTDQQTSEENRRRYSQGEYADFIEH